MGRSIATAAFVLCCLLLPGRGLAHGERDDGAGILRFPSPEFPSLQRALDAAEDGDEILLGPGVHRVAGPLFVRRNISIRGQGCRALRPGRQGRFFGRRAARRFTRLVGPVADHPPEPGRERGLVVFEGARAGGSLRGVELEGLDVGVLIVPDPAAPPPREGDAIPDPVPLRIDGSCVSQSFHGLLATRPVPLLVTSSLFQFFQGSAVLMKTSGLVQAFQAVEFKNTIVSEAQGACMHFENQTVLLGDDSIGGCQNGGVSAIGSKVVIIDTNVALNKGPGITLIDSSGSILGDTGVGSNRGWGILLFDSSFTIQETRVIGTTPDAGLFGDGIVLISSSAFLLDVEVGSSTRAGIANFGSAVSMQDTKIRCAAFELNHEVFFGEPFSFSDLGSNTCGCPAAIDSCHSTSAGLEPEAP